MSLLSNFASAGFAAARSVIGGESISIGGGAALSAVLAESDMERDYELGGFGESQSLPVVVFTAEFVAAYTGPQSSYIGKTCTARGITWRVKSVSKGVNTTRIELISPKDSA